MNKYLIFNIAWVIGFIIALEAGYYGTYFLVSTALMCIVYRKQLWFNMKTMSEYYTKFCKDTANKINPYKTYDYFCDICGEEIPENKVIHHEGKDFCSQCAKKISFKLK